MKANYMKYPKPVSQRSGCKVSWHTYDDRAKAEECAIAAKHNAEIAEAQGYDFGYQCPGSIDTKADGTFEVTLP